MEDKYYGISIYSITGNVEYEKICFDFDKAFNQYKREIKRLRKYKIISKLEFWEEDEEEYKVLENVEVNKQIEHEKLSCFSYRKLYELFRCITSGSSYYKEGEWDYSVNGNEYAVDKESQFSSNPSVANAEYRRLVNLNVADFYCKSSKISIGNFFIKLEQWIYNHSIFIKRNLL